MTYKLSNILKRIKSTSDKDYGYLLSHSRKISEDIYEISDTDFNNLINNQKIEEESPLGLGDAVKNIIHAGLDILPISNQLKVNIKGCSKCAERAAKLNKLVPQINIFKADK